MTQNPHDFFFHGFSLQSEIDLGLPFSSNRLSEGRFLIRSKHMDKPSFWTIESDVKNNVNQPQFRVRKNDSGFVFEYPDRCIIHFRNGSFFVESSLERAEQCVPYLLSRPFSLAIENYNGIVLHATSCLVHGRLVALLGPSGAGKTTLCLALAQHGHHPHTDDIVTLDRHDPTFSVPSGPPWFKVWPDSGKRFIEKYDEAPVLIKGSPKRKVSHSTWNGIDRHVLQHILVLNRNENIRTAEISKLSPVDALLSLISNSHLADLDSLLPDRRARMAFLANLSTRVGVWSLNYPTGFQALPQVIDCIERHVH